MRKLFLILIVAAPARAHDTWVQTNTNLVRVGDRVHLDLMLGNHGNNHREFKIAGKADRAASTLVVLDPLGRSHDLRGRLFDMGAEASEGFWSASFATTRPGVYVAAHTFDKVMSYAPVRAVKSAKAFFGASRLLDAPVLPGSAFRRVLGHPLELVAESNPIAPMRPGVPFSARLLWKGKPLAKSRVSFVPRGVVLRPGFDARFERASDAAGRVRFAPPHAGYYLVVAHREAPDEKGRGYESTKYSATLTLFVP